MENGVAVYTDQYLHISELLRSNLNISILQRIISQNKFIKIQFISLYLFEDRIVSIYILIP